MNYELYQEQEYSNTKRKLLRHFEEGRLSVEQYDYYLDNLEEAMLWLEELEEDTRDYQG